MAGANPYTGGSLEKNRMAKKPPNYALLHKKLMEMTQRAHKAERLLRESQRPIIPDGTLKLCPFCGTMPHMDSGLIAHVGTETYWIECYACGAIGPEQESKEQALDYWNTRFTYQEDTDNA